MRTRQSSQKQSLTSNSLVSRPFAVQPTTAENTESSEIQGYESQMPDFTIFNPTEEHAPVQAKLAIAPPGDQYEQEADQIAQLVIQRINAPAIAPSTPEASIQRQVAPKEVETSLNLESSINNARSGGQSLDAGLQASMGQAIGADFSGVRIHTDTQADQLNQSIQARAFTTGKDVFFRQGEYQPGNRDGQELIAHELTHVVQQNGKAVQRQPNHPKDTNHDYFYLQKTQNLANIIQPKLYDELVGDEHRVQTIIQHYTTGTATISQLTTAVAKLAENSDTIVNEIVQAANGKDALKAMVTNLSSSSSKVEEKFGCLAIQAAFGIQKVEGFGGTALSRLWPVLETVPAKHINTMDNTSLKALVRQQDNFLEKRGLGVSWYKPDTKTASIAYGKSTLNYTHGTADRLLRPLGMPFLSDPQSELAETNLFDQTVLHEIGHAVDDKLNIMDRFGQEDIFGGWEDYKSFSGTQLMSSYDSDSRPKNPDWQRKTVEDCVEDIIKGRKLKDIIKEKVEDYNKNHVSQWNELYPDKPKQPLDLKTVLQKYQENPAIKSAQIGGDKLALNGAKGAWQLSDEQLQNVALNGRVFHKAYAGTGDGAQDTWASYTLAARQHKVSFYQWRAPGEWFAEIYASFFLGVLPTDHPAFDWLAEFIAQNQHINPDAVENPTEWKAAQEEDSASE